MSTLRTIFDRLYAGNRLPTDDCGDLVLACRSDVPFGRLDRLFARAPESLELSEVAAIRGFADLIATIRRRLHRGNPTFAVLATDEGDGLAESRREALRLAALSTLGREEPLRTAMFDWERYRRERVVSSNLVVVTAHFDPRGLQLLVRETVPALAELRLPFLPMLE